MSENYAVHVQRRRVTSYRKNLVTAHRTNESWLKRSQSVNSRDWFGSIFP